MLKKYIFLLGYSIPFLFFISSCINQQKKKNNTPVVQSTVYKKPVSNYQDSLFINTKAAVFYHPDSLQLINIKAKSDSSVFETTMHELFYQMRNARMVLKASWPEIKIIEAKNLRYLVFRKADGSNEIIDLDNFNDTNGLFIFDLKKSPQFVDMMNIETALSFYFNK